MRYKLAALAAVLACAFGAATVAADTGSQPHFNRTIYVVDHSSAVSGTELANDLPALQRGLEDFESYWGGSIRLRVVASVPYRAWGITISDNADCTGCLGYHGTRSGVPYGKVFVLSGYNWTTTFTHELFELAADPYIHRSNEVSGRFYLVEVADPVEDDQFAYSRPAADGTPVKISDFVTDQWYRQGLSGGKYDFTNHVKRSLELMTGGYVSYWGYQGWTQAFGRGRRARLARAGYLLAN